MRLSFANLEVVRPCIPPVAFEEPPFLRATMNEGIAASSWGRGRGVLTLGALAEAVAGGSKPSSEAQAYVFRVA
jgi:hypothetical protein